jgi:hypothetical protein
MLEPYAVKVARTVLRGRGRSNAPLLPDLQRKAVVLGMVVMRVPVSELGPSPWVVLVDRYGDGTIWWVMEDAEAKWATVCLDGRAESPTRFRLIDGTRHPRHSGGRVLDLGCPEEGIVVPLLSHWLDSQQPADVVSEYFVEVVREALLRLGEPAAPGAPTET